MPSRNHGARRLITLTAALTIAAAPLACREPATAHDAAAPSTTEAARRAAPGPWGALSLIEFVVEAPAGRAATMCELVPPPTWRFPGRTRDGLGRLFEDAGITPGDAQLISQRASCDAHGCTVAQTLPIAAMLTPAGRSTIYGALLESPESAAGIFIFRRRPEEPALWSPPELTPRAAAFLRDFSFRLGPVTAFANLPLLCDTLPPGPEREAAIGALLRVPSVLAELRVGPESNLDQLVAWWGQGGREREVRAILESAARVPGGVQLDLTHLLPPWARAHLYAFPEPNDPPRDCHYTAFNFFAPVPDERLTDTDRIPDLIRTDYVDVDQQHLRFGDVVLFTRTEPAGTRFVHSAVYLADDLFFSKNGRSTVTPWVLIRLPELRAIYASASELHAFRHR